MSASVTPISNPPRLADVDDLLRRRAWDEAKNLLESMLPKTPGSRDLLFRLADIALLTQRPTDALMYADRLVELDGADHDALFYKAKAEAASGNTDAALQLVNRLDLLLHDKTAPFLLLKGNILAALGDYPAAIKAYEAALAVDSSYGPAYQNLDHILRQQGNLQDAQAVWKRLTSRMPEAPAAWAKLADVSSALGEAREAQACLEKSAALDSRNPETWYALGRLYAEAWNFERAKYCLEQAIALDPGQDGCLSLLGWITNELGDPRGALAKLSAPTPSFSRRLRGALLLPQIYDSRDDLERWRARYSEGLAAMHAALDDSCPDSTEVFGLTQSNFLLAYQGKDDLSLQAQYARLLRRMLMRTRPDLVEPARPLGKRGRKIRIAFVSSYFRECTISHYFRSWIENLDASKFEPMVVFTGGQPDAVTKTISALAATFVHPRGNSLDVANTIIELQPDILVYPEIGMHSTNYLLANMRLAPVQCAAWGHPVTTGSDLIDYYFTCTRMEPPGSDAHYAERLLRLPGLGTRYCFPQTAIEKDTRRAFSLPPDRNLYICPQSLFKVHPDNDSLYLDVLEADDKAVIVFFQSEHSLVTRSFADRLSRAMADRGLPPRNQIKFLPRLNAAAFRSVLASADVVLDTVHWSGGNTSLDALIAGAPVVTLPGAFMRGRQSKAMLDILGVPELIAASREEYVDIALRLAADPDHRESIRQRVRLNRGELFDRVEPLHAFAQHLEQIHDSAC